MAGISPFSIGNFPSTHSGSKMFAVGELHVSAWPIPPSWLEVADFLLVSLMIYLELFVGFAWSFSQMVVI